MIRRIVLENWRSHARSELEFGKGTNVIVGIVGSGKTSVTDAICFALYGTFPALSNRRVSLEEMIMNKPNRMDSASILLEFDYAGKEYRIERNVRRRGQNDAKMFDGGRLVAGTRAGDVTRKVEEILGVDFELFSRAIYSEQNNIDYFLRLGPAQRKEKMDDLLQLNRYERARANAVLVGNRLKKSAEERKKILEEQRNALRGEDAQEMRRRLAEKEKEIERLEGAVSAEQRALGEKEDRARGMEKAEKEHRSLSERLIKLCAKAEGIEKTLREAERGPGIKEVSELRAKCQKELRELKEGVELLRKGEEDENKKISELLQMQKVNEGKIGEIMEVLERLGKASAHCPVCKSELDEVKRKELIAQDEREAGKLQKENGKLMHEKTAADGRLAKISAERRQRELLVEGKREKIMKLDSAEELAGRAEKQCAELAELSLGRKGAEKQIRELGFDEERLRAARRETTECTARVGSLRERVKSTNELVGEMKAGIRRIEAMEKQAGEMDAAIRHTAEMADAVGIFTNSLMAAQAELRNELINTVNAAMDDVWGRIYPYADYTSARIDIREGDYEVMVRERLGGWVRAEGILSGGERSTAAVTIRIALSLVLTQNLGWLILDEPTHNLDVNAVRALAGMMREHLPELVEQVFIITHDKLMEEAASSSVYLLERDKSEDGVTRIAAGAA